MPIWNPTPSGASSTLITATGTWKKPSAASFVHIWCSGNGGNGSIGSILSGFGPGGAGGGLTYAFWPAYLVPNLLYIFIAPGGAGQNAHTYVSLNNDVGGLVPANTFIYANGGGNAVPGANATGGAAAIIGNMLNAYITTIATNGVPWATGGLSSGNSGDYTPTNYIGQGQPGCASGTGAGGPGGTGSPGSGYVAAGNRSPAFPGALGGTNASPAGQNGLNGTMVLSSGMFYLFGGTGGGGGCGTIPGNGGNGGNGALSSGGGGGGGAGAGMLQGIPGLGGSGYVKIITL